MDNLKKISFIYFDAMNVLLQVNKPESYYFSKLLKFPETEYETIIQNAVDTMEPELQNEFWNVSTLENEIKYYSKFHTLLLKYLDIPYSSNLVDQMTEYRIKPDYILKDGAEDVIKRLSKKYKLGVLTNAMPSRRFHELRFNDIDTYFSSIIISREVGSFKPDIKIYETAIAAAKVSPSEILFIDDKEKYLEGAIKAGIENVILFNEHNNHNSFLSIKTFSDLLRILPV